MHNGYASFTADNAVRVNTAHTMSSLGIDKKDCGAFVAGTNMTKQATNYVNAYTSTNKSFQLAQNYFLSPVSDRLTAVKFGFGTWFGATDDPQINGVFVGSRNDNDVSLTRIKAARVAENVTTKETTDVANTTDTIDLWYNNTVGDVSTVGITFGLTAAQTETLAGLLYDLCVGIGHTALENTT